MMAGQLSSPCIQGQRGETKDGLFSLPAQLEICFLDTASISCLTAATEARDAVMSNGRFGE